MAHGLRTDKKVLAIGLGALLAPVLLTGAASAASADHHPGIAPIPPVAPVASVPLARGAAGTFDIQDAGVHLAATASTDVVMVQTTVQPHSSTGWHTHPGPSMVIVKSGAVRLIEPRDRYGCTEETFAAGAAFAHPADVHDVANDSASPAVVVITYFVPAGASPALVPATPPPGC
jgi:quercetin dioxygenase-like cupin family protein